MDPILRETISRLVYLRDSYDPLSSCLSSCLDCVIMLCHYALSLCLVIMLCHYVLLMVLQCAELRHISVP